MTATLWPFGIVWRSDMVCGNQGRHSVILLNPCLCTHTQAHTWTTKKLWKKEKEKKRLHLQSEGLWQMYLFQLSGLCVILSSFFCAWVSYQAAFLILTQSHSLTITRHPACGQKGCSRVSTGFQNIWTWNAMKAWTLPRKKGTAWWNIAGWQVTQGSVVSPYSGDSSESTMHSSSQMDPVRSPRTFRVLAIWLAQHKLNVWREWW